MDRLALDVDGVLSDYVVGFLRFLELKTGIKYLPSKFVNYKTETNFPELGAEFVRRIHEEFMSPECFRTMPLIDGSQEALTKLKKDYKLYVITNRGLEFKEATISWLLENFGDIFEDIIFAQELALNKERYVTETTSLQSWMIQSQ